MVKPAALATTAAFQALLMQANLLSMQRKPTQLRLNSAGQLFWLHSPRQPVECAIIPGGTNKVPAHTSTASCSVLLSGPCYILWERDVP